MRIHIGQISDALAANIGDLETRLDRFGTRQSPLSLHRKEFGDHHFGFVDMDLDPKQYAALSKALNGMMFRQSKLQVKEARPSYTEIMKRLDEQKTPAHLNPEQKKRLKAGPNREIDVFPGRMRESPHVRTEPTFRVKIKGEVRKPKMRKRKLWGIEKRPIDRLVAYFADGEWRDVEGRAVEIVDTLRDEHAQAERIAADFAQSAAYLSDSDFEDFKENARELDTVESDNEIEVVPSGAPASTKPVGEVDDESDVDTQATVGRPMIIDALAAGPTGGNTTENLRSALSADAPFTLFGAADNEDNDGDDEAMPDHVDVIEPSTALAPPTLGLFFTHASPYLRSQTQASKLVATFDPKAWETEFFENRGEWNRELRKRRRDAVRSARRMGKRRGE